VYPHQLLPSNINLQLTSLYPFGVDQSPFESAADCANESTLITLKMCALENLGYVYLCTYVSKGTMLNAKKTCIAQLLQVFILLLC
jgi:hypothetical protein